MKTKQIVVIVVLLVLLVGVIGPLFAGLLTGNPSY